MGHLNYETFGTYETYGIIGTVTLSLFKFVNDKLTLLLSIDSESDKYRNQAHSLECSRAGVLLRHKNVQPALIIAIIWQIETMQQPPSAAEAAARRADGL